MAHQNPELNTFETGVDSDGVAGPDAFYARAFSNPKMRVHLQDHWPRTYRFFSGTTSTTGSIDWDISINPTGDCGWLPYNRIDLQIRDLDALGNPLAAWRTFNSTSHRSLCMHGSEAPAYHWNDSIGFVAQGATKFAFRLRDVTTGAVYLQTVGPGTFDRPTAPTGLTVKSTTSWSVSLQWNDNSYVDNYFEVQRATAPFTTWTTISHPDSDVSGKGVTSFVDNDATSAAGYKYRVRAANGDQKSAWSNVVGVHMPTGVAVRDVKPFSLEVSWGDNTSDESAFQVERSEDGGATWQLKAVVPTVDPDLFVDNTVHVPADYLYRVRAMRVVNGATVPTSWSSPVRALLDGPFHKSSAWWEPTNTMESTVAFGDPNLQMDVSAGTATADLRWSPAGVAWDEPVQPQYRNLAASGVPVGTWAPLGPALDCGLHACTYPHTLTLPAGGGPEKELRLIGTGDAKRTYLQARTVDHEPTYVAMGDSYSSGQGLPPYTPESGADDGCHRSLRAYSAFVAPHDMGTRFIACDGAVIANVSGGVPKGHELAQLDQGVLTSETDLVTITIGGNDLGWPDILRTCSVFEECASPNYRPYHPDQTFEEWLTAEISALYDPLRSTYREIKSRTLGRARVLVAGYPMLFPASLTEMNCPKLANLGFSMSEQELFRRMGNHLNSVIAAAAGNAAAEYVSPSNFAGHEVCGAGGEWINYVTWEGLDPLPGDGSFHPNAAGQRSYAVPINLHLIGADFDPWPQLAPRVPHRQLGRDNPGSAGGLTISPVPGRGDACAPGRLRSGAAFRLRGDGFRPGSAVEISATDDDGTTGRVATARANRRGSVRANVALQGNGARLLRATGRDAGSGKRILSGVAVLGSDPSCETTVGSAGSHRTATSGRRLI